MSKIKIEKITNVIEIFVVNKNFIKIVKNI